MKIAVLVSGGVDSSVALKLLKDQGHDITAFYLKIWLEDELAYLGDCPWQEDLGYVTAVCEKLNVPLEVISLQKEYHDRIVSYVIAEIKAGRTPNPDILCNQHIKFGAFYDKILSLTPDPSIHSSSKNTQGERVLDSSALELENIKGSSEPFQKIATGHYAQVFEQDNKFYLKTSPDLIKDQTYFLARLSQEQLSRALFPIGHLTKPELRDLAQKFDLPTKNRKDSQGICFLGKLKYSEFIKFHVGEKVGNLVEFETGKKLGTHKGFWFYTIGQRQGTGLSGGPWYVVSKDTASNTVFISRNYYTDNMQRDRLIIENCNWISDAPKENKQLFVKLRHGQFGHMCELSILDKDRFVLKLYSNDQGISPGQFAVLYDGEICLGSGVISC